MYSLCYSIRHSVCICELIWQLIGETFHAVLFSIDSRTRKLKYIRRIVVTDFCYASNIVLRTIVSQDSVFWCHFEMCCRCNDFRSGNSRETFHRFYFESYRTSFHFSLNTLSDKPKKCYSNRCFLTLDWTLSHTNTYTIKFHIISCIQI